MTADPIRGHSYDGIEEFDNRLPNWWLWSFYLACIFSVGYWLHYHTIGIGDQPTEAYAVEQKLASDRLAAKAASNPITEQMLLKLSTEPGFVAEGKKLFEDQTKCAQCHGPLGHGITAAGTPALGPNLTDDHWIYGSKPMDVYTTILKGQAPDLKRKTMGGMQAWDYMGTDFVLKTTAYVLSIKNTNVAGGKAPEAYAVKEP